MSKSAQLRVQDVHALNQLVGECRDLGDDATAWHRHCFACLARLTGADLVFGGTLALEAGRLQQRTAAEWGAQNGFDLSITWRAVAEPGMDIRFSPPIGAYFQQSLHFQGPGRSRKDLVTDREWIRSPYCQRIQHPLGIDHTLVCFLAIPGRPAEFNGITLSREKSVTHDFSPRDRELVQEAHALLTALIGGPLAGFHEPSPAALPPRPRQVLRCLLEGDADKQIARRLGLSSFTVNQYTKVIFRHFGVQGRAELSALWVRRGYSHGNEPSPSDLPPRPRQVLRCLLQGDSDKQAARRLGISSFTVNQYTKVLFRHFGVQGRAELMALWVRRGFPRGFAWAN